MPTNSRVQVRLQNGMVVLDSDIVSLIIRLMQSECVKFVELFEIYVDGVLQTLPDAEDAN